LICVPTSFFKIEFLAPDVMITSYAISIITIMFKLT